ncbi:MAG TPA: hypothetical protein VE553_08915 [Candidatus Binatia bacterium]|nr:hypothetical protein [Candidatus Binatia bacterium]
MEAPLTQQTVSQSEQPRSIPTAYIIGGIILSLLLLALFIWFIIWAASNYAPTIEALRDIFIIALALESCVFGVILAIMLVMIVRLVNMLEFEIKPILEKTNETVGMVRGTTTFVGENVVKPVTKATAYVAGISAGLKALFGDPHKNLPD